jgi:hypothetical protein
LLIQGYNRKKCLHNRKEYQHYYNWITNVDKKTSKNNKKRKSLQDKRSQNPKEWTENNQKALDDLDKWFHQHTVKAARIDARKGIKQHLLGPVQ